jgi:hypothetical protein
MAKKFSELRAKMTPEASAQANHQSQIVLQEGASKGTCEDFDRFLTYVPKAKPSVGDVII